MTSTLAPFTLDQIGTGTARFPSGVAIPDADGCRRRSLYPDTRVETCAVDCIQFWPQEKGLTRLVLLHEAWGLTRKSRSRRQTGVRRLRRHHSELVRALGGMVTANARGRGWLMGKLNESLVLQDINSCCEFLNTRDHIKQNIHGVSV